VYSRKLSFVILNICRKWLVTMAIATVWSYQATRVRCPST